LNNRVLMISAGSYKYHHINLDYSLLSIASLVSSNGFRVKMFQGDNKEVNKLMEEIGTIIDIKRLSIPILVSIPSFDSLEYASDLVKEIKSISRHAKIIVIGKNVVESNVDWLSAKIPEADRFIEGSGEEEVLSYLNVLHKNISKEFNYSLLNNYDIYAPTIDMFDGNTLISPLEAIDRVSKVLEMYDNKYPHIFFNIDMCILNVGWCKYFAKLYRERNMLFKWRCMCNVSGIDEDVIKWVSLAGLDYLSLRLISASPKQLEVLSKAKDPLEYVEKAADVLEKAYKYNIKVRVTAILYAGETIKTYNETCDFLIKYKNKINEVYMYPLCIHRNTRDMYDFITIVEKLSGKKVKMYPINKYGQTLVNLSDEISIGKALQLIKDIENKINK